MIQICRVDIIIASKQTTPAKRKAKTVDNIILRENPNVIKNQIRYTWDCDTPRGFDFDGLDSELRRCFQLNSDDLEHRRFQVFTDDHSVEGWVWFTIDDFDGLKPVYRANVRVSGIYAD